MTTITIHTGPANSQPSTDEVLFFSTRNLGEDKNWSKTKLYGFLQKNNLNAKTTHTKQQLIKTLIERRIELCKNIDVIQKLTIDKLKVLCRELNLRSPTDKSSLVQAITTCTDFSPFDPLPPPHEQKKRSSAGEINPRSAKKTRSPQQALAQKENAIAEAQKKFESAIEAALQQLRDEKTKAEEEYFLELAKIGSDNQ